MALQDRVQEETNEKKNALEAHIYSLRGKLSEQLAPFASEAERASLGELLDNLEVRQCFWISRVSQGLRHVQPRWFPAKSTAQVEAARRYSGLCGVPGHKRFVHQGPSCADASAEHLRLPVSSLQCTQYTAQVEVQGIIEDYLACQGTNGLCINDPDALMPVLDT